MANAETTYVCIAYDNLGAATESNAVVVTRSAMPAGIARVRYLSVGVMGAVLESPTRHLSVGRFGGVAPPPARHLSVGGQDS